MTIEPNPQLQALVRALIPDLDERMPHYQVDTSDVDDELLQLFIGQIETNLKAMDAATGAGNWQETGRQAHSIKGMGGTAGAPELSVLAEDVERACKAQDTARYQALCTVLHQWLDGFRRTLPG